MTQPKDPAGGDSGDAAQYEELRRLLLGPEVDRIDHLSGRIDDLDVRADDVALVLPDAILRENARGDRLASALAPTIEEALQVSIRRNPKALADAVSPIMGPAIRRSIMQAINGMLQTFNQAMEQSFSPRSIGWRIEAWRTGRSFGEVVALQTLIFHVEQVFLIHKGTGLLLLHRSVRKSTDPDLVGAMLVAIRDFVSDSFEGGTGTGTLDTVRIGDRTVWVEGGRDAVLAVVVQGHAPERLRDTLAETLEQIEVAHGEPLRSFDGDASVFAEAEPLLAECMVSQARDGGGDGDGDGKPKRSRVMTAVWATVGLLLLFWVGLTVRDARRWSAFVDALEAQPGIVVTQTERQDGRRVVRGLRDPMAAVPVDFLAAASLDTSEVAFAFEPYHSMEPELLLSRAVAALAPPDGVTLRLAGDRLIAAGPSSAAWRGDARTRAALMPGISGLDTEGDPAEVVQLEALSDDLGAVLFTFAAGTSTVTEGPELTAVRALLITADSLAGALGRMISVTATGSADSQTGSLTLNTAVAARRARAVVAALPPSAFPHLTIGVAARVSDRETADLDVLRTVVFSIDPRAIS